MDDNQSLKLANLQQRLEESERNTILAATYGKQLLEQNQILHVKLEETVKEYATKVEIAVNDGQDMNSLFTGLYSKSQKQITDLQQQLQTAEFEKVVLNDRILQLQRQLRRTEVNLDAANAESLKLSVKLDEMATKAGKKTSPDFKEDKRVVQKIPDFEKFSPITKKSQVRAPEMIVPLKEKLVDPTAIQTDKQVKIISTNPGDRVDTSSSRKAENQENEPPHSQEIQKKRIKLVRMTETVAVQNSDGEVKEIAIKLEDGNKKVERKEKVLRKMEAPIIKITNKGQSDECKLQ
ncbi:tropomyosin [Cherax quadricarinatus]